MRNRLNPRVAAAPMILCMLTIIGDIFLMMR